MSTKLSTATITFHASHNYGSMLQAYALQQVLLSLGVDNAIINFRSNQQKQMYADIGLRRATSLQTFLHYYLKYPISKQLHRKYELFEQFLSKYLILTSEYNDECAIYALRDNYDIFIAGSDQIWNTICRDYSDLYYLPFATGKAISYAASLGPEPQQQVIDRYSFIIQAIKGFRNLSVREIGSAQVLKDICGVEAQVHIDPTMLLVPEYWKTIMPQEPLINRDYVFWYTPYYRIDHRNIAMAIADGLHQKVVTTIYGGIKEYTTNSKVHYKLDVGPIEFLNLLYHAKVVVSGSFHAIVFAILFHKPFWAINGDEDNRMSNLLRMMGLMGRAIHANEVETKMNNTYDLDFTQADKVLTTERERSLSYLKAALKL